MRFSGFVSAREAAKRVYVNERTMRTWAHQSLDGDERAKLRGVQQTATGMLLIPLEEVERFKPRGGQR